MSSVTDTSDSADSESTSSPVEYKKRRSSKKHKHKNEKKHKKQKKNKKDEQLSRKQLVRVPTKEATEDSFGPALPPHLFQKAEAGTNTATTSAMIGPVLPANFVNTENHQADVINTNPTLEDDDIIYGPMPLGSDKSTAQMEREKRALELKIAAIEGRGLNSNATDQKSREEWMLELPEVGLRGGLAALSNMKRTFHTGKEKPDFSDRSAWTRTPQSESGEKNQMKEKPIADSLRRKAEAIYERDRDAEQDRLAKKHKKKHKRNESLMELHQKKLLKEQKKKEKELAASGSKPERRPFSRDIDLKLNKIDSHQTKQIVEIAKILDSKFSSGKTKYL